MKQKYSPMMMQYLGIKEQNKDAIVMFRLGDFYEMFFDDAIIVSKELELALTGKNAGAKERVPMCAGAKFAILTATHETGFGLWQSDVNPYCMIRIP